MTLDAHITHDPDLVRPSTRLAGLFDGDVVAVELCGEPPEDALYPDERPAIAKAVPKRRREFIGGRVCARVAMVGLGVAGCALPAREDRCPEWPDTVVGSITHTDGFCGAVVARAGSLRGIGIDVERRAVVGSALWPRICTDHELRWLSDLSPDEQEVASALLFSAKEAFYKCQYPLTGQFLSFHDVSVRLDDDEFTVSLLADHATLTSVPRKVRGRYHIDSTLVFTGVAL